MITVKVEGADQLARGFSSASQSLAGDVRAAMTASLVMIEADARRNVKQDTRRLAGSITHRISGHGAALTGEVGPSVEYGFWVHQGRKPGGRMPPVKALEGWARRHGNLNPFLVARAIARRGIPPNPFMTIALQKNQARITERFSRLGIQIASRIVTGH